jgi:hypothetical protein
MSPKLLSGRLAVLLALMGVSSRSTAAAAPTPVVQEPGEGAQYRALLEEAVTEYDARHYEEARALFRRANEISPNARTLRGIGMASFELREYIEALRSLEASLVDKRRPLTPTQRQQVESLLDRTRAFVGRFFLKASPKETVLRVDGTPIVLEGDGSLLLSFGRHSLVAEAAGSLSESRELNVIGGERQELTFQLRPDPNLASARKLAGAGVGATPGPGGSGETDSSSSRVGWWFTGAAVLAAGAVGSYFWWRSLSDQMSQCDQAKATSGMGCDNGDALSSRRRLAIGATIGTTAAALAVGIAGTVFWSTNSKPESGTALACGPAPGAVNCELRILF